MGRAFRVNTYGRNWQDNPDVIAMRDGGFLIVYDSYVNNYDDGPQATVVMSQRYDAAGRSAGRETLIAGIDRTAAEHASATLLSDGGYAVAWTFDDYDDILTTREKVYVQAFDADGTSRTGALRVDTVETRAAIAPDVFATAKGGFKVVFGTDRSGGKFDELFGQQFDRDGDRVGGNRLVNTKEGEHDQFLARSATLENGSTITIWNSEGTMPTGGSLDSNEVRGTITAPSGAVTRGDFSLTINYGTVGTAFNSAGRGYDVAALQNGGFVVTNKNYDFELGLDTDDASYYTMMRFFDASGRQKGGPVVVFNSDDLPGSTRVAQVETGEIVVVWSQDEVSTGSFRDTVYGRVFSETGRPLGGVFDIGADVPRYFDQHNPEIAALSGGGFVVTFMSEYIDGDDEGIAARVFGRGTAGDDRLRVDASGQMAGLGGDDRLEGNGGSNALSGGRGHDLLLGRGGRDALDGGSGRDDLRGHLGRDALYGGDGDDRLEGGRHDDRLFGGRGRDELNGGDGADFLKGGAGRDVFVFDQRPAAGPADRIADFRAIDEIALDGDAFGGLGRGRHLADKAFHVLGEGRLDRSDRILYDDDGRLYYDRDGSGGAARHAFAILDGAPEIDAGDFLLI